jgi:hypothetical protein
MTKNFITCALQYICQDDKLYRDEMNGTWEIRKMHAKFLLKP